MSAPVRFLVILVVGWAGVRAASLGVVPAAEIFTLGRSEARPAPPPVATFPPLEPAVPFQSGASWHAPAAAVPAPIGWRIQTIAVPYYIPSAPPPAYQAARDFADTQPYYSSPSSQIGGWSLSSLAPIAPPAAAPLTAAAATSSTAALPTIEAPKFDRLQLTSWALLRGRQGALSAPQSLASGGTLGGSQAGARLTYRFSPEIAASLRTTASVGTSQSEIAAGLRFTPVRSIPLSITAERRQAIGRYGARSAFAVFAEAGLYQQPLAGFQLDGYAQGGVVGMRDREFFADGGFTLTRPMYRQFSGGFGLWGGVQPGIFRVDAGPRLSMRLRPNVRVHLDWRQRLAGEALPGSGPALTLAGDF